MSFVLHMVPGPSSTVPSFWVSVSPGSFYVYVELHQWSRNCSLGGDMHPRMVKSNKLDYSEVALYETLSESYHPSL